ASAMNIGDTTPVMTGSKLISISPACAASLSVATGDARMPAAGSASSVAVTNSSTRYAPRMWRLIIICPSMVHRTSPGRADESPGDSQPTGVYSERLDRPLYARQPDRRSSTTRHARNVSRHTHVHYDVVYVHPAGNEVVL